MSDSISQEANVLRYGYEVGYFDKPYIAQWADRWILALDEPCDELFDLSMNRRLDPIDVSRSLQKLAPLEPALSVQIQFGFVGLLYEQKNLSAQHAKGELFLLIHEPDTTDKEASRIYYLDDAGDLAYLGAHASIDEFKRELGEFLSPYAEQLVARYPQLFPSTA